MDAKLELDSVLGIVLEDLNFQILTISQGGWEVKRKDFVLVFGICDPYSTVKLFVKDPMCSIYRNLEAKNGEDNADVCTVYNYIKSLKINTCSVQV